MSTPFDTPWRRVVGASYPPPNNAYVETNFEVDVEAIEAYIQRHRQSGRPLGLLHFVVAAVARTIASDVPEMNTYLRRGRVHPHEALDIVLPALIPGSAELVDVRVRNAHQPAASAIATELHAQLREHRTRARSGAINRKFTLGRVPWPLRRLLFKALAFLSRDLGFRLPRFEMTSERFGSLIITEVGRFLSSKELREEGVLAYNQIGGAPFPVAQNAGLLAIGPVQRRAVVVGDRVEGRRRVLCGLKLDHRLVDGLQGGRFCTAFARRMQHPEQLDRPGGDA